MRVSDRLAASREIPMTLIRHSDNDFDNARMTALGYEIIAIETHTWPDGVTETEIVWGRDDTISEADLSF
jgi:hypothetical protein